LPHHTESKMHFILSIALTHQIHAAGCKCTGSTCLMLMWMAQRMLCQQLGYQEHNAGPPSGPG